MIRWYGWGLAILVSIFGSSYLLAQALAPLRERDPQQFVEIMLLGASSLTGVSVGIAALFLVGEWQDWVGLLDPL